MYLLGLRYLEALPAVAQGRHNYFSAEQATGVMGALGGLRQMFRIAQTPERPAARSSVNPAVPRINPAHSLRL